VHPAALMTHVGIAFGQRFPEPKGTVSDRQPGASCQTSFKQAQQERWPAGFVILPSPRTAEITITRALIPESKIYTAKIFHETK